MSTTQKRGDRVKKATRGEAYTTQAEKKEAQLQKEAAREKYIRDTLNEAFATPSGEKALTIIMDLCGYNNYDAVARKDTGTIDMETSFYNSARRSVYLDLRAYINRSILKETEHPQ